MQRQMKISDRKVFCFGIIFGKAVIKEELANQSFFMVKSIVSNTSYQTNGNHATEVSAVDHVISEGHP